MSNSGKKRQCVYFPGSMLDEIYRESARLDCSLSRLIQYAWRIARKEIRTYPSVPSSKEPSSD